MKKLAAAGVIFAASMLMGAGSAYSSTITIDNLDSSYVDFSGSWNSSKSVTGYLGSDYYWINDDTSVSSEYFTFELGDALSGYSLAEGSYDVVLNWTAHPNRTTNVTVTLFDGVSSYDYSISQYSTSAGGATFDLGTFTLSYGSTLTINVDGVSGVVVADAVLLSSTSAVPEPATCLLMGSALAGFGVLRRKRQKR